MSATPSVARVEARAPVLPSSDTPRATPAPASAPFASDELSARRVSRRSDSRGITLPAPAQSAMRARPDRLERSVASIATDLQRAGFSGSVLVARGDRVLLDRGFGRANPTGAMNDGHTRFDVASVSKQFTAAAIMKLVEEGRVRLDDPVSRWVPVPADRAEVTLRDLLEHRSGLGYPPESAMTDPTDPVAFFGGFMRDAERVAPRGERFHYNNLAYSLLAYVVQRESGLSYEQYVRSRLLGPAGMTETTFDGEADTPPSLAAVGNDGAQRTDAAGYLFSGWGARGCTGVVSSTRDMLRWSRALQSDSVLSRSSREALFRATHRPGDEGSYALGWFVERDAKGQLIAANHSGATAGFVSQYTLLPAHGVTIIVLSNQSEHGGHVMDVDRRVREALGL